MKALRRQAALHRLTKQDDNNVHQQLLVHNYEWERGINGPAYIKVIIYFFKQTKTDTKFYYLDGIVLSSKYIKKQKTERDRMKCHDK